MKELAVILASGGMDSCVNAATAHQHYELAMLHVQYGQRTQAREYRAFEELCHHFRAARRLVANLDHLKQIGGSSLTDSSMALSESASSAEEIPTSYVPFRNAHLLSIATSWAEVIGATRIFFGAVEEDSSGYPDCRKSFVSAFNSLIEQGTRPETHIEIETPLIHLSKAEIVKRGLALNAPLSLTWSCYQNEDEACGRCDSCALRLRGFLRAGVSDPIPYRNDADRRKYR